MGWNDGGWESICCQCPGVAGWSRGSRDPSTAPTGLANVSVSAPCGRSLPPAAGSEMILGPAPEANQATRTGVDRVSHLRAAAATVVVPVLAAPDATTPIGTTLRPAPSFGRLPRLTRTRLTGSAKRTVTTLPGLGRSRVARMCGTGVVRLTVFWAWRPTSQPIQPGRRTSTVTLTSCPAASRTCGHTMPRWTVTGTGFPSSASTDTFSTWPEKPGSETDARPLVEAAIPAVGHASRAAAAAPATTRTRASMLQTHTRNMAIQYCLRSERDDRSRRGQRDPARAFTRRDRRFPPRAADRPSRLPCGRRDVCRPAHLRL